MRLEQIGERARAPNISPPSGCASMMPSVNRVSRSPGASGSGCAPRSVVERHPERELGPRSTCSGAAAPRCRKRALVAGVHHGGCPPGRAGRRRGSIRSCSPRRRSPASNVSWIRSACSSIERPAPAGVAERRHAERGQARRRQPVAHRIEEGERQRAIAAGVVEGVAADLVRGLQGAGEGDSSEANAAQRQQAPLDLRRRASSRRRRRAKWNSSVHRSPAVTR